MYCHLCGAEVPDEAETCPECGVDLGAEIGTETAGSGTDTQTDGAASGADTTGGTGGPAGTGTERADQAEQGSRHGQQADSPTASPEASGHQEQADTARDPGGNGGHGQPGDTGGHPTGAEPATGEQQGAQGGHNQSGQEPGGSGTGQPPRGDGQPVAHSQGNQQPAGPQGGHQQSGPQGGHNAGQPQGGQQSRQPRGGQQAAQPQGGQPAGGSPQGGYGGGHGGGFDVGALLERLPLLPAAVGGAIAGIVVMGISLIVAALFPVFEGASTLELGAVVTMDLHFATPEHLTPFLFADFQTADPPEAVLGLLYIVGPLLLYQISKLVVEFGHEGKVSLKDGALSGASMVAGYLPLMLIAALLIPGDGMIEDFSLLSALVLAGVVYPLVFGALGGVSATYFSSEQRRVGTLYGIVGFIVVFVGLFVSSYVFIDTGEVVELEFLDRLFATIGVLAQTHGLAFGDVGEEVNTLIPILLTIGIVGAMGFLRVWRSRDIGSPVDALARAITPAVAYVVLFGVFASVAVLFADPWVQDELQLGFITGMFAQALALGPLESIGAYVNLLFKTLVVFPIVTAGTAGVLAWWLENRNQGPY